MEAFADCQDEYERRTSERHNASTWHMWSLKLPQDMGAAMDCKSISSAKTFVDSVCFTEPANVYMWLRWAYTRSYVMNMRLNFLDLKSAESRRSAKTRMRWWTVLQFLPEWLSSMRVLLFVLYMSAEALRLIELCKDTRLKVAASELWRLME